MTETTSIDPAAQAARPATQADLPPHALLWDLATLGAVSRCLHAVAWHGVADALDRDGTTVDDLAARLGLNADALGRVLRALASYGVFEVELPQVHHNDVSLLLQADHPMSMAPFAHMMGLPMSWDAMGGLPATLETGRAGVFDLDPGGLFSYLRDHPEQAAVFDHAMTAKSLADIPLIMNAFDFAGAGRVIDVAGGRGHLLRALVERHPGIDVALFELSEVIERLADDGDLDGVRLIDGDFFTDALPPADLYVLMEIIHDWDDADAERILANVRRNAPDNATILIIETVLGGRPTKDPGATLDIVMLTVTGGRERTPAEHGELLGRAGWALQRTIPTGGGVQMIEATAVS
jgi:hypothetical protein